MAQQTTPRRSEDASNGRGRDASLGDDGDGPAATEQETTTCPATILELLGDEYTREVLEAVAERPRSGGEVADATSVSKPTAFRRLNRLADAGLVVAEPAIDVENGNHCNRFRAVFAGATLEVDADGLSMTVETVADGDGTTDPDGDGTGDRRRE